MAAWPVDESTIVKSEAAGAADHDENLPQCFERVAAAFASRPAIVSNAWRPTYGELNETANRLAHALRARGVASGDRVAMLMDHDAPAICAYVGIVKAGAIVVILNTTDPAARLSMLLQDAEPSLILTDGNNRKLADNIAPRGCQTAEFEPMAAAGPAHNPGVAIPPEHTLALVYTSGSTGRPKGVMRTHLQSIRNIAAHTDAMLYTERDRLPFFSSLGTGQGSSAIWCALLNGATMFPFAVRIKGVTGLADWIIDQKLTVYWSSASVFRTLMKTIDERLVFSNIRAVRLASEPATPDDFQSFRKHFPRTSMLVHTLSSSETSNMAWSRWSHDDVIPEGPLPVGNFSRSIEVFLLGDDGEPVPRGEVGEIAVKSRFVAAGYWRDPELTAQRFSESLDERGTRIVRLGDRGRINAAGMLEFRGRKDDRVKIRGNRIELSDVERAVRSLPAIERAAVIVVEREHREPILAAFVIAGKNSQWSPARLRHAVGTILPPYMVPSRFVLVDSIPLGPGGKIDREALRRQPLPARVVDENVGAQTDTETMLAELWAELFEVPNVGREEDFFSLGGDSLIAAIVAAHVHATLGVELSLAVFADCPTLSTLASYIDRRRQTDASSLPPIVRVSRTQPLPLSLFQERIWKLCRTPEDRAAYMHSVTSVIKGPLDIEILKTCLSYLTDRHEVLRTTFEVADGRPVQVIHPSPPLDFSFVDLSGAPDATERATAILRSEGSQLLDLSRLPAVRYVLIKIQADEHWLLRVSSIIADGSSWRIHRDELAVLYDAALRGIDPPLPKEMPLQYADFAVWQRELMRPDGRYFNEVMNWWKNLLAKGVPSTRLPFRRLLLRRNVGSSEGVIKWQPADQTARRLDEIARKAGATHFIVRLAAFVALIAEIAGKSDIVIGTQFTNRSRAATQHMFGLLTNLAPVVFSIDGKLTFHEWVQAVRDRLFETESRCEIPYEELRDRLRAAGLKTPDIRIIFAMSSDHSEQSYGSITFARRVRSLGNMTRGCTVYVDEHVPSNCGVFFDARLYDRNGMQAMVNRYLRLLEAAARDPEQPVENLLAMTADNSVRWTWGAYVAAAYDFLSSRR